MGSLSYEERLAIIVSETSLLVTGIEGADLSIPVPATPNWTLNQLLRHLGHAHRWIAQMVGERFPEVDRSLSKAHSVSEYTGETAAELGPWLIEGASLISDTMLPVDRRAMIAVLRPGEPGPDFWSRRMAHETVMHRWDAFDALGLPFEVDERVAYDTLYEWITAISQIIFDLRPAVSELLGSGALHFETTDTAQMWTVDFSGTEPRLTEDEENWSVAVRGPVMDILLALYRRRGAEGLEVTGDAGLLAKFLDAMRF
ncbi:maleylpyruvate isomerase family mycothiol-dependent enzyme [Lentzea sp. BCCO 10_0061]|uniref:Maleylpyruvate isomerase family mycothiol-dependent enzyme n=1 Tax=Lentzea sokolovensis TaxID=3095429 RepID=A0ABU4UWL1_9PSEU|nr:maleylpyruvate isomerase family mycothiol-dependent enzyme [Lentzea sp. BCCO 10_0061]MDX8143888.1 maleylpyruvate isomerase family mycothiol-dependent enzyme [Lentzea sp. BCCO 10_0061]